MKIKHSLIQKSLGALFALALIGCQDMDRPELGEYPTDANASGGPLKFYTAFDGTSSDVLMNAVDSVRAKFPSSNSLASIDGINGKAVQGEKYKYIKFSSANDFAKKASSFTVSLWEKQAGAPPTSHLFSMPATDGYHWSGGSMFLLVEGSVASPVVKLFVKDATGEKWFEFVGANAILGIFDGNWHHLAFSYDATTSTMTSYKDGVAGATSTWTGHGGIVLEPAKITSLKVGAGPQEFSAEEIAGGTASDWLKNSWVGGIDQFRLYASALTATEVQTLYTNKK